MSLDYVKDAGMDAVCRVGFEIPSEVCEAACLYLRFATVLLTVYRHGNIYRFARFGLGLSRIQCIYWYLGTWSSQSASRTQYHDPETAHTFWDGRSCMPCQWNGSRRVLSSVT